MPKVAARAWSPSWCVLAVASGRHHPRGGVGGWGQSVGGRKKVKAFMPYGLKGKINDVLPTLPFCTYFEIGLWNDISSFFFLPLHVVFLS